MGKREKRAYSTRESEGRGKEDNGFRKIRGETKRVDDSERVASSGSEWSCFISCILLTQPIVHLYCGIQVSIFLISEMLVN